MFSPITLSLFIISFFTFNYNNGRHITQAHIFIYAGCSQDKYPPNSPYQSNKNTLLSSVAASSQSLFNAFAVGNDTAEPPEAAVYGVYQCRGDLKSRDCSICMADLINQIELLCPDTYGGNLQLDGCFLRYERTDFLRSSDNGLRYRRCSRSGSNDAEFLKRRDDVLDQLQGAEGFRVGATGAVEGYAQCLGELMVAECSSCLGEAVAKVRMLCGSAAAGDVFLARCYVRYWEAGFYDSASESSNHDDVGRTVAIIVGVVAGVAIMIVLLSFCRKALG